MKNCVFKSHSTKCWLNRSIICSLNMLWNHNKIVMDTRYVKTFFSILNNHFNSKPFFHCRTFLLFPIIAYTFSCKLKLRFCDAQFNVCSYFAVSGKPTFLKQNYEINKNEKKCMWEKPAIRKTDLTSTYCNLLRQDFYIQIGPKC